MTGEDEPRSEEPLSSSCLLSSKPFQPAFALFPGTSSYSGAGIVPASCMAISPTHQFVAPHSTFFQTAAVAVNSSAFFSSVPSTESSSALLTASATTAAPYSPALASTNSNCTELQPDNITSGVHFEHDVQSMPADVQVTEDVHGENGYSYFQISSSVRHLQQSFYQHSPYHQYNDNNSPYHNLINSDLREKMNAGDVSYIQTGLTETELEISCRSEPSEQNNHTISKDDGLSKDEIPNSIRLDKAAESSISTEKKGSNDDFEKSIASKSYSMNQLEETKLGESNKSSVHHHSENIVQTKQSISYIVKDDSVGCNVSKTIEETVQTDSGLESTSSLDSSDNSQDYSDFHTTEHAAADTVTSKSITTTTTEVKDTSENDVSSDDSGSQSTFDESTSEDSQFNDSEQVINVCHLKDAQSDYQPKKQNLCQTDSLSLSCETDDLSCQPNVTNQAMDDILKQNLVESTRA